MAASAEAGAGSGATATAPPPTTSRFAAACGTLSRYVKAAEMARASRPLPLMPGADVEDSVPEAEHAPTQTQMTIFYGGRVLVLDDVPADKATGLLQAAATAAAARDAKKTAGPIAAADLPVARKASLQRFMEKRKGRVAARAAPYSRLVGDAACPDRLELALCSSL